MNDRTSSEVSKIKVKEAPNVCTSFIAFLILLVSDYKVEVCLFPMR